MTAQDTTTVTVARWAVDELLAVSDLTLVDGDIVIGQVSADLVSVEREVLESLLEAVDPDLWDEWNSGSIGTENDRLFIAMEVVSDAVSGL